MSTAHSHLFTFTEATLKEHDRDDESVFEPDPKPYDSQNDSGRWALYRGKSFRVCGFDDEETTKCIVEKIEVR